MECFCAFFGPVADLELFLRVQILSRFFSFFFFFKLKAPRCSRPDIHQGPVAQRAMQSLVFLNDSSKTDCGLGMGVILVG